MIFITPLDDYNAKNFSIYLEPGGSYRLTPLYDVMSVYPQLESNTIPKQKAKMAMALRGTSKNHYLWSKVQPRHFLSTAKAINFPQEKSGKILTEMLEQASDVALQVTKQLPASFPHHISEPILQGMTELAKIHSD